MINRVMKKWAKDRVCALLARSGETGASLGPSAREMLEGAWPDMSSWWSAWVAASRHRRFGCPGGVLVSLSAAGEPRQARLSGLTSRLERAGARAKCKPHSCDPAFVRVNIMHAAFGLARRASHPSCLRPGHETRCVCPRRGALQARPRPELSGFGPNQTSTALPPSSLLPHSPPLPPPHVHFAWTGCYLMITNNPNLGLVNAPPPLFVCFLQTAFFTINLLSKRPDIY